MPRTPHIVWKKTPRYTTIRAWIADVAGYTVVVTQIGVAQWVLSVAGREAVDTNGNTVIFGLSRTAKRAALGCTLRTVTFAPPVAVAPVAVAPVVTIDADMCIAIARHQKASRQGLRRNAYASTVASNNAAYAQKLRFNSCVAALGASLCGVAMFLLQAAF